MVGSLLALTWTLLTCHCQIEAMPGFDFLRCPADAHASSDAGDPCKKAGCCSIESAKYQAPRQHEHLAPIVVVATTDDSDLVERSLPKDVGLGILTAAPPENARTWQFAFRTAAPPRAPTLPS
jgi:hypothetical protein